MNLPPFPTPLKNGVSVLVKEVTPADRDLLEIGFAHLSDQKHSAEIAVTIADSHQHQGLGSLLLGVLAEVAKRGGIIEFIALVHSENTAMPGLLEQFGGIQRAIVGEDIEVTFPVSAISVQVPNSTAGNCETPGEAAWAIINRTSAKLRRFANLHPELPEIVGPDQPTSVWENEGGAIV